MTAYFPVMYVPMPLNANGDGPADAADTVSVAHEVWDAETNVTICTAKDEATANLIVAAWNLRTQAPDSWRPIETASKDGTEILIYRDGWQEAPRAKWGDHDGEDEDDNPTVFGGWFLASEWHTHGVEGGFLGWNEDIQDGAMPTHWMPLPAAPALRPQTAESGT